MTDQPLTKISNQSPAKVLDRFEPSDEAREALAEGMTAEQFLRALIAAGLYPDAAQFLAHALPKREAVWWGCVVARSPGDQNLLAAELKALHAAGLWVRDPSDALRRAAMQAANEVGVETAAGMVGVAAYMSTDPMGPVGGDPVPPPGTTTGAMVGGAVVMTAVTPDPLAAAGKYARFLEQGMAIAAGRPATG